MASNAQYNYGLFWRAIAVSLLLHTLLLLQPGLGASSSPNVTRQMVMALLLTPADRAATQAPVVPSPSHTTLARKETLAAKEDKAKSDNSIPEKPTIVAASSESRSDANATNTSTSNSSGDEKVVALEFDESKKSYLFAIAAEARRFKKYPARAIAAGWTGTAEITIDVAAGGNVKAPMLHKSSGYEDIDNAALSLVGIALKRTPVPQSLRTRAFNMVLPVSFNIHDE